jgi:hypothetical protein
MNNKEINEQLISTFEINILDNAFLSGIEKALEAPLKDYITERNAFLEPYAHYSLNDLKLHLNLAQDRVDMTYSLLLEELITKAKKYNRGIIDLQEVIEFIYDKTTNLHSAYREHLLRQIVNFREILNIKEN